MKKKRIIAALAAMAMCLMTIPTVPASADDVSEESIVQTELNNEEDSDSVSSEEASEENDSEEDNESIEDTALEENSVGSYETDTDEPVSEDNVETESEGDITSAETQSHSAPKAQYLYVKDMTLLAKCDLAHVSVGLILDNLTDKSYGDGNPITIDSGESVLLTAIRDESGRIVTEDTYELQRDMTLDLSEFSNGCILDIRVGTKDQLNNDAEKAPHYLITISFGEYPDFFTYELWSEDKAGNRKKIEPINMDVISSLEYNYNSDTEFRVIINDELDYYLGVNCDTEKYPFLSDMKWTYQNTDISSKLLASDMSESGAGYLVKFIDNKLYKDKEISYNFGVSFGNTNIRSYFYLYADRVGYNTPYIYNILSLNAYNLGNTSKGYIYKNKDGNQIQISPSKSSNEDYCECQGESPEYSDKIDFPIYGEKYKIYVEDENENDFGIIYDFRVDKMDGTRSEMNEPVIAVYEGLYESQEDAENDGAENIADLLTPASDSSASYPVKFGEKQYFSVFFEGDIHHYISLYFTKEKKDISDDNSAQNDDNSEADPYLNVYSAYYGENYKYYYTEYNENWDRNNNHNSNGKYAFRLINTSYNKKDSIQSNGYTQGYQTIFINDKDFDLSNVVMKYKLETGNKLYFGNKQITEEKPAPIDFSHGAQKFTVIGNGEQHNYYISFVKPVEGSKLFVNGPQNNESNEIDTRDVVIDESNDYQHYLTIANIGDQPLTGITLKLDCENLAFDEYYTVQDGSTLEPFDTDAWTDGVGSIIWSDSYTMPLNMAKIKLIATKNGTINGTLTISADGQEDVVIKLSGEARIPGISDAELPDAVKYVPYSSVISTDNINNRIKPTFTLDSGSLPDGITLNESTGEVYGVAKEFGDFEFTVKVTFTMNGLESNFPAQIAEYKLHVEDNYDDTVLDATDEDGYDIQNFFGELGTYQFDMLTIDDVYVVDFDTDDMIFKSEGKIYEYIDLWVNGEKLDRSEYKLENGSTKITLMRQAIEERVQVGRNTIAMEFRVDGDRNKDLKRSSHNFYVKQKAAADNKQDNKNTNGGNGGMNSGNNGMNGGSSAPSGAGTASGGSTVVPIVTNNSTFSMSISLMSENGKPLTGFITELHSKVQTAVSDDSGKVSFSGVEQGTHTLYFKDSTGKLRSTKEFEITPNGTLVMDGQKFASKKGAFDLTLRLSVEVEDIDTSEGYIEVTVVETAKDSTVVFIPAILVAAGLTMLLTRKRADRR